MLASLFGKASPAAEEAASILDVAWRQCLYAIAAENGHQRGALRELPAETWEQLLGFVVARMSNEGYVPVNGWREALAQMANRPDPA